MDNLLLRPQKMVRISKLIIHTDKQEDYKQHRTNINNLLGVFVTNSSIDFAVPATTQQIII